MAILESLKRVIGGASDAIGQVKGALDGILAQLAALDAEQGLLLTRPASADEVKANLARLVADMGRRWREKHAMELIQAVGGRIEQRPGGRVALVPPTLADPFGHAEPFTLDFAAACGVFPDQLLEGLHRVVTETAFAPGPPMAGRIERLSAIERERETLRREHARLVDAANAAGVPLEHLPEERAARLGRVEAHKRWEADGAANRNFYRNNPSARPPEPK
jgi:hypothetical protein